MPDSIYPTNTAALARHRKELAPDPAQAFEAFSRAVFADGALDARTKQLIAVAVAHVTQCPYCIKGHQGGAAPQGQRGPDHGGDLGRAEMRAGGAYAHSALALDEMEKAAARPGPKDTA
ncbi:MAG: carboxymuconolactone decarboxylase family protein [Roseovarius sp.]|nr:carboxymuconolactone decarboxylase family protein [Roseovarius sp.]